MVRSQSFTYGLLGLWMGWVLICGFPAIAAAVGSVTTEGDEAHFARALREELGVDGSGVRVAVIADGANNHAGAVATGDLPLELAVFGSCTPTATTTCNVGTAMLEIIHDLAPGAELAVVAFDDASRAGARFDMMRRINEVAEEFGADIVVQAPRFFQEPYFEDGVLAQHVAQHVANGVLYVIGAGDEAERHYEADFTPISVANLHDFGMAAGGASDTTMDVRIEPGQTLTVWLQWAEPFGGASSDYDLVIRNERETRTLASGSNLQNGNDNPLEVAMFTNSTAEAITVKLLVRKLAGEDRRLEMFVLGGPRIEEYGVPAGSIFGVAAVPGVMAVGAVPASAPDVIEPFSSRGPALIAIPERRERQKPDLVAVDAGLVSASANASGQFVGGAAAAAHIAGIAALLRQALPTVTATELREALKAGADDLREAGPDDIFGAGLAHALQALDPGNEAPNGVIETPEGDVTIEVGESVHFTSEGEDPDGPLPLEFAWDFGGGAPNTSEEDPGDVAFDSPGEFTVTLTVTDGLGLSDATPATRQITVVRPEEPPNEAPNGVIETPEGDVTIEVGESVHFTSEGEDPDGPLPLEFAWDFGGGAPNTSEEDPGDVAFDSPGEFTVTLTVTDGLGLSDATPATRQITVVRPNQPPNGVIDEPLHDVVIAVGESVHFTSTGSDPDGPLPLSYRWDFLGGALNMILEDPGNVRFDRAGAYWVTLTVVDGLGLPDPTPATRLINVRALGQ